MSKLIDMTGWVMKEHGVPDSRITVIKKIENIPGEPIKWHCKCDCGNECDISGYSLRSGKTKSCGCLNKEIISKNLTGQRFGKLIALEPTNQRRYTHIIWKCKCDCGNIHYVASSVLISNDCQSCGCLKSKGEAKISQILRENNLFFEQQKTFNNCKFKDTNCLAYFDFYVNNQYIIEFDGEQHFHYDKGWNTLDNFKKIQEHDRFKNQYCKENNIPIIRIPYTHLNNICLEDLIPETSDFLVE